jgi:hypothetical protein
LSNFETHGVAVPATAGVAGYVERAWLATPLFQKSENAALGQKMPFVDGH